jgi:hypothetical protein
MYFDSLLDRWTFLSPPSLPVWLDSHHLLGARPLELISSLLMLKLAIGDKDGL